MEKNENTKDQYHSAIIRARDLLGGDAAFHCTNSRHSCALCCIVWVGSMHALVEPGELAITSLGLLSLATTGRKAKRERCYAQPQQTCRAALPLNSSRSNFAGNGDMDFERPSLQSVRTGVRRTVFTDERINRKVSRASLTFGEVNFPCLRVCIHHNEVPCITKFMHAALRPVIIRPVLHDVPRRVQWCTHV